MAILVAPPQLLHTPLAVLVQFARDIVPLALRDAPPVLNELARDIDPLLLPEALP